MRAPNKRIVICLDGTWNNTFTAGKRRETHEPVIKPTNVLKACRSILPRDDEVGCAQTVYYDTGIGSLTTYPGLSNMLLAMADKLFGGGWGAGFEANMEDALGFLATNFEPGDEVYLFGFSRGAATAQALTRFLDWCAGLPARGDTYYLPVLLRAYIASRGDRPCQDVVSEINAKRARDERGALEPFRRVDVTLLGVWDTVLALGWRFKATGASTAIAGRSYHVGPRPARCVRNARQALAIDEARYDFRPAIWRESWPDQSLEQRWFAGVHSNIGGGYVDDGLANLPFQWILGEAKRLGLRLDAGYVAHFRGYAQDRLYRSESLLYRVLDALRFRFGKGQRALPAPDAAHLELDRSVIHRLRADPHEVTDSGKKRFPELDGRRYRPAGLLSFLARVPDLDAYLQRIGLTTPEERRIPDDVRAEIERLRRG